MAGFNNNVDLIQNMRLMTQTAADLEKAFAEVEPSMETIFNLRDQFENLEQRTITIVNNFETSIGETQAEAEKIIDDLNDEVARIQEHIDELLNLSDNFDSIAEELKTLVAMKDTVDELVKKVEALDGSSGLVVIPEGEDLPASQRKEGTYYLHIKSTIVSGIGQGTTIYVSPTLAMKVE